jgi:hypothetical protein
MEKSHKASFRIVAIICTVLGAAGMVTQGGSIPSIINLAVLTFAVLLGTDAYNRIYPYGNQLARWLQLSLQLAFGTLVIFSLYSFCLCILLMFDLPLQLNTEFQTDMLIKWWRVPLFIFLAMGVSLYLRIHTTKTASPSNILVE